MGKNLFKVRKITLEQRPNGLCSSVILLTWNLLLPAGLLIKAGDQFLTMADPGDLKEIMDEYGLRLTEEMRYRIDSLKDEDTTFIEVVVSPESPLVGRGRSYLRRRSSNHLILMAVARQDKPIHKRLGKVQFRVGDVLLLQGREEELKNNILSLDLLPLAEREIEVGVFSKVSYALLIFAVAILLSMLSIVPTTVDRKSVV